jgi:predicted MFS family arabinose efflux permease
VVCFLGFALVLVLWSCVYRIQVEVAMAPPWVRVLVPVTVAATASMLPVFLLGSAAPGIRADLRFDTGRLGVVVSAFWITMAVGGLFAGRLAHALGAVATTHLGVVTSVVALLGLSLAPSWMALIPFAAVGGIGCAITTPAVDMALFEVVPVPRRGLAYGVKQASLPAASLLAGVCVPALVLTAGWRWAFAAGLAFAVSALIALPRRGVRARPASVSGSLSVSGEARTGLNDVIPVAVAVGLAMSGVSSMGAFYVESAITSGESVRVAGFLLALGSVFGIAGRFLLSWRLEALSRPYAIVALLIALGGAGAVAFAVRGHGVVLVAGTVVAFGAGWGWNGLLTQTVVTAHPEATARASAYIMVGAAVGGVAGPVTFGLAESHFGYRVAWSTCAVCFLLAAVLLFVFSALTSRRRVGLALVG